MKISQLFLLGLFLAVFSPVCRADFTCGTHDPTKIGRIKVDGSFATDTAGNMLNVYCVDDIYFEGEIVRADGTRYPFAKCVYDLGANGFYVTYVDGKFKDITWANVDVDNSGKTLGQLTSFLKKMDDETMAQWLARINDLIKTKGLNSNIYMTSFSPGDQEIDQDLLGVDQSPIFLTPSQAVVAYDPLNPIPALELDPDMFVAPFNHPQQVGDPIPEPSTLLTSLGGILLVFGLIRRREVKVSRFWWAVALLACALAPGGRADMMLTVDLTNGPPSPGVVTITPATSSTPTSYDSNGLNFGIANDGDGVALNFSAFSADCVIFQDLSLSSFAVGDGLDFGLLQGDPGSGDESDLRLFQVASSVQIKVVETTKNVTTTLTNTVAEINMADIKDVRIDWVPFAGRIDRIYIEITTKTGQTITKGADGSIRSNFVHDPTRKSAYTLTGLNISKDPQVSMGSIMLLDTHVPEPSTFAMLVAGVAAVVLFRTSKRELARPAN